ncbi:MAG: glycosyltransferase [Actinomycetota bacterium]|nr:glycosyltransferase [Actinomycetota bacterium]
MRVLHVYKDVYPPISGGIERHINAVRTALPDVQQDVLVCARKMRTMDQPSPSGQGREVLVAELGRVLSTPIAPSFPAWLVRLARGAIVHLHMPQPLAELSVLLTRVRSPLVVSYHADIYRQRALLFLYRRLVIGCLRQADVVITGSERLRASSQLLRDAGVSARVVPYGIDVARWAPEHADPATVEQLRSRYGHPHVLAVGRLVPYKGFDRLILAARQTPHSVVIVGEGRARTDLERQIRRLRIGHRVHLVGEVSDTRLGAHLAAASLFVLPSTNRAEAYGISLLEAQAAELPVIATDVGTGTVEAFAPGRSGHLIPPNDIHALVEAISGLLNQPKLRYSMGKRGRELIESRNSLESMARRLRPIYEDLWSARYVARRATSMHAPSERSQ